jgi:hypothetical protein
MPPMPADADAPPDFVTPFTASAAASASVARRSSSAVGEVARQQRRIREPDIFVIGSDTRHRDRALGKLGYSIARYIIGRDHRLALADQHAQTDIVAFRTLGLLDASVAHLDALRNAAHRDRIRRIRAGALGRLDEALRQFTQGRLVK